MEVGLVAATVTWCTSRAVAGDGIGGVGQLQPQPAVDVLLHKWVNEKTAKSIQGHHWLHKIKALHVDAGGFPKQINK